MDTSESIEWIQPNTRRDYYHTNHTPTNYQMIPFVGMCFTG